MVQAAKPDGLVVGLCGSHASRAALYWAVAEAGRRGCSLTVVTVLTTEHDDWAQINRMQAHLIRAAADSVSDHRPPIRREWVAGRIGPALVGVAQDAAMLVIGLHQPRVSGDTALGFVTEHCLREATCPVVVVPATTAGVPLTEPELSRNA